MDIGDFGSIKWERLGGRAYQRKFFGGGPVGMVASVVIRDAQHFLAIDDSCVQHLFCVGIEFTVVPKQSEGSTHFFADCF